MGVASPDMADERTWNWHIADALVGTFLRTIFRLRVEGAERIPDGGGVIVPNHISSLDPLLVGTAMRRRQRMVRFLSGTEFFAMRWVGKGLRFLEQIPLRRGESDQEALGNAIDVARAGGLTGLFPEGRINNGPALLLRGRRGAARIAVASGAPLVPVGIWGTQVRYPGSGLTFRRPWRPTVAVVFGDPIEVDPSAASAREILYITNDLMAQLEVLVVRAQELAGRNGFARV